MTDRTIREPKTTLDQFDVEAYCAAADLAGIGLWSLEVDTGRIEFSTRAVALYGASDPVLLDGPIERARLQAGETNGGWRSPYQASRDNPQGGGERLVAAGDGAALHLRERWRVTEWTGERPRRIVGVVIDISEEHRDRQRRRELIHELQHRMKNMLATIRSLARRTAAYSGSVEAFTAHFDGRLAALAQVQATLARTQDGRADLEDIVRQELVHSLGGDEGVSVSGPIVLLRGKTAELIALALHELSANAVKFGALSEGGQVSVTWTQQPAVAPEPSRLVMIWRESGLPAPPQIERRGFGLGLIEKGLPYELDAMVETEFLSDGLVCRINLPVAPRVPG